MVGVEEYGDDEINRIKNMFTDSGFITSVGG